MRTLGTVARGVRAPMIQPGDNLANIVVDSVLNAANENGIELQDRDVIGMTEAIVARSQNNFATVEQIATDVRNKFNGEELAIVFPILSRNRFSNLLRGIVGGCKKLYIMLSYPSDEVGNQLIDWDMLDKAGVNPYTDVLDEKKYRELFGYDVKHPFTGMDYAEYYKSFGDNIELIFANDPRAVLTYTKNVLACDIHTRQRTKRILKAAGAEIVYGLDEILAESVDGSGYNENYGLLGSNKATEDKVKLFPRDCQGLVDQIQATLLEKTGKRVEVMVYGDGAFKDPVGKIWELADPVVSPAYTSGLNGTPNELKLKFLLDNDFAGKSEEEARAAMEEAIKSKDNELGDQALGTTPRRYTDLLGSLCDLMSGSGDKGTPIIWISGYFENFASK
ncbi:coenzyme F420-0:L-glutamate ligase [Anaerosporobacter sp.]|uniref:coenzyme F420-0:L-glutamate ligase n=1 Tax=Anaerosporobacter sp. TaxID=1872529 RepID=UPI00286F0148|nr:coenzyme F420-0:L-glutamate ligase [Anaerosporobacter sp.]